MPFTADGPDSGNVCAASSAVGVVNWLADQPGATWQQRWMAGGAEAMGNADWWRRCGLGPASRERCGGTSVTSNLRVCALLLVCADAIRPSLAWLLTPRAPQNLVTVDLARPRDPEGFAELAAVRGVPGRADDEDRPRFAGSRPSSPSRAAALRTSPWATAWNCRRGRRPVGASNAAMGFYELLHAMGVFGPDAPPRMRAFATQGQLSPAQLIDRYGIICRPVRELLVAYLQERQPMLDHTSLPAWPPPWAGCSGATWNGTTPASTRCTCPRHRRRLEATRDDQDPAGPAPTDKSLEERRAGGPQQLARVRAFHLDIAQWAMEEPAAGDPGPPRAPSAPRTWPGRRKYAPASPAWTSAPANGCRSCRPGRPSPHPPDSGARLSPPATLLPGQPFTAGGELPRRHDRRRIQPGSGPSTPARPYAPGPHRRGRPGVLDLGGRRNPAAHRHPHRGTHRTLPPQPDPVHPARHRRAGAAAADRAFQDRRRTTAGGQPRTCRPLAASSAASAARDGSLRRLLRRPRTGLEPTDAAAVPTPIQPCPPAIPGGTIRDWICQALDDTGLTDAAGQPLRFTPHDFRRLFITDAVLHGMPPHIAQLVAGHRDINTTMAYKAVYPEEAINGHRAFIARRRALRPSEEYRAPTDQEWRNSSATSNIANSRWAHAAAPTPRLHPRARLLTMPAPSPGPHRASPPRRIRDNLIARIEEARDEGWLGEVEGLQISLARPPDTNSPNSTRSPTAAAASTSACPPSATPQGATRQAGTR